MKRYSYVSGNSKYDLVVDFCFTKAGAIHIDGCRMFKPGTETYVGYWSARTMPANVRRALTAHATKWWREQEQKREFERKIMGQLRRDE